MQIEVVADKSHFINHDLNFREERYESKHVIVSHISYTVAIILVLILLQAFKNPKSAFLAALRESGPVPGDENGVKKRSAAGEESAKKKKRGDKNVSYTTFPP